MPVIQAVTTHTNDCCVPSGDACDVLSGAAGFICRISLQDLINIHGDMLASFQNDNIRRFDQLILLIDNSGSIGSPVVAQSGSGNQAFVQQGTANSATVEFHNEMQTLLSVARIVEERWDVLASDLSRVAIKELQEALRVIRDSEGAVSPERRERLKQAAGSLVRLCGQLVLGAGGNGLYEALKAIAGI